MDTHGSWGHAGGPAYAGMGGGYSSTKPHPIGLNKADQTVPGWPSVARVRRAAFANGPATRWAQRYRPYENGIAGMERHQGLTLIELMIVVVVISILASIAYPAYQDQMNKAKRAEGKAALVDLANRMEKYAYTNGGYSGANVATLMGSATTEGGYYLLQFSGTPTATAYTLQAVPQAPFSDPACQTLSLTQADVKGATGGGSQCW